MASASGDQANRLMRRTTTSTVGAALGHEVLPTSRGGRTPSAAAALGEGGDVDFMDDEKVKDSDGGSAHDWRRWPCVKRIKQLLGKIPGVAIVAGVTVWLICFIVVDGPFNLDFFHGGGGSDSLLGRVFEEPQGSNPSHHQGQQDDDTLQAHHSDWPGDLQGWTNGELHTLDGEGLGHYDPAHGYSGQHHLNSSSSSSSSHTNSSSYNSSSYNSSSSSSSMSDPHHLHHGSNYSLSDAASSLEARRQVWLQKLMGRNSSASSSGAWERGAEQLRQTGSMLGQKGREQLRIKQKELIRKGEQVHSASVMLAGAISSGQVHRIVVLGAVFAFLLCAMILQLLSSHRATLRSCVRRVISRSLPLTLGPNELVTRPYANWLDLIVRSSIDFLNESANLMLISIGSLQVLATWSKSDPWRCKKINLLVLLLNFAYTLVQEVRAQVLAAKHDNTWNLTLCSKASPGTNNNTEPILSKDINVGDFIKLCHGDICPATGELAWCSDSFVLFNSLCETGEDCCSILALGSNVLRGFVLASHDVEVLVRVTETRNMKDVTLPEAVELRSQDSVSNAGLGTSPKSSSKAEASATATASSTSSSSSEMAKVSRPEAQKARRMERFPEHMNVLLMKANLFSLALLFCWSALSCSLAYTFGYDGLPANVSSTLPFGDLRSAEAHGTFREEGDSYDNYGMAGAHAPPFAGRESDGHDVNMKMAAEFSGETHGQGAKLDFFAEAERRRATENGREAATARRLSPVVDERSDTMQPSATASEEALFVSQHQEGGHLSTTGVPAEPGKDAMSFAEKLLLTHFFSAAVQLNTVIPSMRWVVLFFLFIFLIEAACPEVSVQNWRAFKGMDKRQILYSDKTGTLTEVGMHVSHLRLVHNSRELSRESAEATPKNIMGNGPDALGELEWIAAILMACNDCQPRPPAGCQGSGAKFLGLRPGTSPEEIALAEHLEEALSLQIDTNPIQPGSEPPSGPSYKVPLRSGGPSLKGGQAHLRALVLKEKVSQTEVCRISVVSRGNFDPAAGCREAHLKLQRPNGSQEEHWLVRQGGADMMAELAGQSQMEETMARRDPDRALGWCVAKSAAAGLQAGPWRYVLRASFANPPREDSSRAVEHWRQSGLAVRMLTGDACIAALYIARQIGIAPGAQKHHNEPGHAGEPCGSATADSPDHEEEELLLYAPNETAGDFAERVLQRLQALDYSHEQGTAGPTTLCLVVPGAIVRHLIELGGSSDEWLADGRVSAVIYRTRAADKARIVGRTEQLGRLQQRRWSQATAAASRGLRKLQCRTPVKREDGVCWMLGDAANDAEAISLEGVIGVSLRHGATPCKLGADFIVDSPGALIPLRTEFLSRTLIGARWLLQDVCLLCGVVSSLTLCGIWAAGFKFLPRGFLYDDPFDARIMTVFSGGLYPLSSCSAACSVATSGYALQGEPLIGPSMPVQSLLLGTLIGCLLGLAGPSDDTGRFGRHILTVTFTISLGRHIVAPVWTRFWQRQRAYASVAGVCPLKSRLTGLRRGSAIRRRLGNAATLLRAEVAALPQAFAQHQNWASRALSVASRLSTRLIGLTFLLFLAWL